MAMMSSSIGKRGALTLFGWQGIRDVNKPAGVKSKKHNLHYVKEDNGYKPRIHQTV